MWWFLLAWIAGDFVWLLDWPWALLLLGLSAVTGILCFFRSSRWLIVALLMAGFCVSQLCISYQKSGWLPVALDGQVVVLSGQVADFPEDKAASASRPASVSLLLQDVRALSTQAWPGVHKISLSDYTGSHYQTGDRVVLEAKLYRPRGLVNESVPDHARLSLAYGQQASGRVVRLIEQQAGGWSINVLRDKISQKIQRVLVDYPQAAGLVPAMVVGDWRQISPDAWKRYQNAGVAHLVVISGGHLTLVAGLGWLLFRFACLPLLWFFRWRVTAQQWAVVPAMLLAGGYCLLAGWSVSTVRAQLMLSVWLLCRLFRQNWPTQRVLALALLVVFLWQPLAPLSNGFWLSFLAVSLLILLFQARPSMVSLQLAMSLMVGALAAFLFAQWYWIDPIANLILIPFFSFVLVPASLMGALIPGMEWLLLLVAPLIAHQEALLEMLLAFSPMLLIPSDWLTTALLMLAMLLLFGRFLPCPRVVLPFLLLPWLWPASQPLQDGEFEVRFFDVGQGQAAVVRTSGELVLYDMGPGWLSSDAGEKVVRPWLRKQRLPVKLAIASHGDRDHVGGLPSLSRELRHAELVSGQPDRVKEAQACEAGQHWRFSGVDFQVLWPPVGVSLADSNDYSCVVHVQGQWGSVLFTGDVSKSVEYWLLTHYPDTLGADVLQLSHHGSKSASSHAFLRQVAPRMAVTSVGHLNALGHPAAQVQAALHEQGVPLLRTDRDGMVTITMSRQETKVKRMRERHRPWEDNLFEAWQTVAPD